MWKDQSGSTLPLVGLMMVGLLAVTGIVIDMGSLYAAKAHLQKTANAAVLSAAQELTNDEASVRQVAEDILLRHGETNEISQLAIEMERAVSIDLKKRVDLYFAQLIGWDSYPVEVTAKAELGSMGRAVGAAPLGVDEAIPLEFNREYKLKVDQTEVSYGNFGILALGGTGAATYEDNLLHGYQEEVRVGDVIDTQTGNIAGKTRRSIEQRLQSCPYEPGDYDHRDCSRVLLIPLYKPHYISTNQLKSVEITGFAYFYITEPMRPRDTSITGKFIKRAGTGFADPNAASKGAYSIRLTK